jgi:hypothetical protein
MFNNILTLGQNFQKYSNVRRTHDLAYAQTLWLKVLPKLIYFEPMFLGLWLTITIK